MNLDDETLDALGYGDAVAAHGDTTAYVNTWGHTGTVTESRGSAVLVAQMSDEQRRAYWREKKAAWRARRPDLAKDADRRASRQRGHLPRAARIVRLGGKAPASQPTEAQRLLASARKARWRAAHPEQVRAANTLAQAARRASDADYRERERARNRWRKRLLGTGWRCAVECVVWGMEIDAREVA